MFEAIGDYVVAGGIVMPSLLLVGFVLWTLLGLRMQTLSRGFKGGLQARIQAFMTQREGIHKQTSLLDNFLALGVAEIKMHPRALRKRLDLLVGEVEQKTMQFRRIIRGLYSIAPLLGLLGTVSGMIETFASLNTMELFAQSGGVAGGISEALVSTQMGLFVAIPGMIVGRLLDRKGEALQEETIRARELLIQTVTLATRKNS